MKALGMFRKPSETRTFTLNTSDAYLYRISAYYCILFYVYTIHKNIFIIKKNLYDVEIRIKVPIW